MKNVTIICHVAFSENKFFKCVGTYISREPSSESLLRTAETRSHIRDCEASKAESQHVKSYFFQTLKYS